VWSVCVWSVCAWSVSVWPVGAARVCGSSVCGSYVWRLRAEIPCGGCVGRFRVDISREVVCGDFALRLCVAVGLGGFCADSALEVVRAEISRGGCAWRFRVGIVRGDIAWRLRGERMCGCCVWNACAAQGNAEARQSNTLHQVGSKHIDFPFFGTGLPSCRVGPRKCRNPPIDNEVTWGNHIYRFSESPDFGESRFRKSTNKLCASAGGAPPIFSACGRGATTKIGHFWP